MKWIKGFARFWYDFIVGDDWTVALGVVLVFVVTAALVHAGVVAWWLTPPAVMALLTLSIWRAVALSRRA